MLRAKLGGEHGTVHRARMGTRTLDSHSTWHHSARHDQFSEFSSIMKRQAADNDDDDAGPTPYPIDQDRLLKK